MTTSTRSLQAQVTLLLAEVDRLTAENEQIREAAGQMFAAVETNLLAERDAAEARAVRVEQAIQRVEKLADEAERSLGTGLYGTDLSVADVRAALAGEDSTDEK